MARLFIVGAGFSKAAGFPLGNQLFPEILAEAKKSSVYENFLKEDIYYYLDYVLRTTGKRIKEEEIDFERFISY